MSEDFIKKLCINLNKNESLYEKNLNILRFQFFRKSRLLKVILRALESLNDEEENYIKDTITKILGIQVNIEILCYRDMKGISLEDISSKYWLEAVGDVIKKNPLSKTILCSNNKRIEGDKIIVNSSSEALINHLKNKRIEDEISNHIDDIFNNLPQFF